MKKVLFLSALLFSTAAVGQASTSAAEPSTSTEAGNDPTQTICQSIGETGSRLSRRRVCMTRAQWEQQRRDTRQNLDRAQAGSIRSSQ